jgi:hypothetical protein
MAGKKSQTIQLEADTLHRLLREISEEFGLSLR